MLRARQVLAAPRARAPAAPREKPRVEAAAAPLRPARAEVAACHQVAAVERGRAAERAARTPERGVQPALARQTPQRIAARSTLSSLRTAARQVRQRQGSTARAAQAPNRAPTAVRPTTTVWSTPMRR